MSWVAAAVVGGSVIGGVIQSGAAKDASRIQGQASQDATAEQRRQYDITREDLAPYTSAGGAAVTEQANLLGLNGGSGDLNRKFTLADFWDDPVTKASYQFGLDEGTKALDRMAGARGNRNSGAQLKALTRYASDYTGQKAGDSYSRFYGDQDRTFNRFAGVAGTGQTATTTGAALGGQTAATIGNLVTGSGNARGAAAIAGGNAVSGAGNTIANWYGQNAMLDKIMTSRGNLSQPNFSAGYY